MSIYSSSNLMDNDNVKVTFTFFMWSGTTIILLKLFFSQHADINGYITNSQSSDWLNIISKTPPRVANTVCTSNRNLEAMQISTKQNKIIFLLLKWNSLNNANLLHFFCIRLVMVKKKKKANVFIVPFFIFFNFLTKQLQLQSLRDRLTIQGQAYKFMKLHNCNDSLCSA